MEDDLATLFSEDNVQTLETLARSMQLETMISAKYCMVRVSNVHVALQKKEFFDLIESEEILSLLTRFKELKPFEAKNYHQMCALKQLEETYGNDIWQWTLDAFEGNADADLCSSILSLVSRAWT
jgi:hypothetical protein